MYIRDGKIVSALGLSKNKNRWQEGVIGSGQQAAQVGSVAVICLAFVLGMGVLIDQVDCNSLPLLVESSDFSPPRQRSPCSVCNCTDGTADRVARPMSVFCIPA